MDKFTMGEYAQLLLTLKVELKRVLTKDQSESEPIGPLFPKELERLLNGVMSARNDFGHGRFRTQTASVDGERASFDPGAKTDEFLTNGLQLIAFPLFQRLALLDNGEDDT